MNKINKLPMLPHIRGVSPVSGSKTYAPGSLQVITPYLFTGT